jgi:hypothetical protein
MTGQTIQRRFGDRERERLGKLFSQLGTDNKHEAEAARSRIDALLRQFDKTWSDLIGLLGGDTPAPLHADLARDIIALGSSNPDERANAWRNIADLLARHRKSWNDLVDALCTSSHEAWACGSPANDLPGVNPLKLVHYLLEEYVALQPHQYVAVALWILHTHIYDRFTVTPRQALCSPVADCGKTTLIDIMSRLTARPEKFDSITTAALYRVIDQTHPTLLIDEADNLGLALQPKWSVAGGLQQRSSFWRDDCDRGTRLDAQALDVGTAGAAVARNARLTMHAQFPQCLDHDGAQSAQASTL